MVLNIGSLQLREYISVCVICCLNPPTHNVGGSPGVTCGPERTPRGNWLWNVGFPGNFKQEQSIYFNGTEHNWKLWKISLLTWCISTNAWNNKPMKILTQWGSKLRDNNGRKTPLSHKLCAFTCLNLNLNILVRNYFFLKIYVTSEGVVSHNVLYTPNNSPLLVTK